MIGLWAAVLLAAQSSAGERCAVEFERRQYAAESPECLVAGRIKAAVAELAESAGIPGKVHFQEPVRDADEYDAETVTSFNAHVIRGTSRIRVSRGFVECYARGSSEDALYPVAHEVGHALQRLRGDRPFVIGSDETRRRLEAQADQIAWDLLERSGRRLNEARAVAALIDCGGADGYLSRHSHPTTAVRWIEAMRRRDKAGRAASAAAAAAGGWRLMSEQGRVDRGVRGVVSTPDGELWTADSLGYVRLGGSIFWLLPPEYSRHFTPREVLAYATREHVQGSTILDASDAGLDYLRRTGAWDLLPGYFMNEPANQRPRPASSPARIPR